MTSSLTLSRTASVATLCLFSLSGCAVGPNFETPAAPTVQSYEHGGLPKETVSADTLGGNAQKFIQEGKISSEWWMLFHSEPLNKLIAQAIKANPDLDAARASLREAEETLWASEGSFFPSVSGTGGATRSQSSSASPFTLYNASVSVSYSLDVFGGTRRQVESLAALADIQRFELEASYLTLTSNVVTTAITEASLRAQIVATKDIIEAEAKQLELLQKQFDLGAIAKSNVLAQAAQLAQTKAGLPTLEKQLAQTRHLLSVLAGQFPSEELEATFDLAQMTLPEELPLSLPSKLVEQRPDIQAATAQLHAASANVGVATANMLPQITLSAAYGSSVFNFADLFNPPSAIWSIGASILQPIFRGGELLHTRHAKEAAFDKAAAQYRSTVLTAFKDVADTLRALQSDAESLKARLQAERAAGDSLALSREQFKAGAISYTDLLNAQQTYDQSKISLVQAQATRYADTAALFQALGGGWWNRQESIAEKPETEKKTN